MSAEEIIAKATLGTKWERRLWTVGGAVRDEILGLPAPPDIDIVLEDDAGELAKYLWERGISEITPVEYARFGAALMRIDGVSVEFTSARSESYEKHSRKPNVSPATLEDDARRRDFTCNTLMRNIHTGEIADPLGVGLADLEHKILRTPLDAARTFDDDPLRMLRAVRFKNRLGFSFAPGLEEAIAQEKERLRIVSGERIRDEVVRMLQSDKPAQCLADLMSLGLLGVFAPEFEEGVGVEQGSYHTKDVWGHTLDVVREAAEREGSLIVRLGALFHDIGKPRTRSTEEGGRVRFFGHERVGAQMTLEILRRLRFGRRFSEEVAKIVANHVRLGSAVPFTASAARRIVRDMGDLLEPLLQVCQADAGALRAKPNGVDFAAIRERIEEVNEKAQRSNLESPLSGSEIMAALGLPAGPEIGKLKDRLTEAVLSGAIAPGDKEAALVLIQLSESEP